MGGSAAALLIGTGCAPVDVEGVWVGTWRAALWTDDGGMTLDLSQDGDEVTGDFDLTGTLCVGSGRVDGSIDRRKFDVVLYNGIGGEIVLDGNVNAASDGIDGDFDVTGGLCDGARGTFKVDLQ